MDERLRICLWMVGGGVFGGLLGGVFGALAAMLYARSGGAAGTWLARNVVEHFLQSGNRRPSLPFHAALIGAVDGFFFLGTLGLIAGAFLEKNARTANELLLTLMIGCVFLVGGAIFFGTMAYALTSRGVEFLYYGCAGGILGSIIAGSLLGWAYGSTGVWPGIVVGWLLCRAARTYSPKFHPPRVGKISPQPRSDTDINITGSPPSPPSDDFFPRPDQT